jgi:phosphoribosylanthranilate isomerase
MKTQLKVKVCGLRYPDNIQQLIRLKPDFMGFILFPGSKRYVGDNYILENGIPKTIKKVGVFVNAVIKDVIHWINRLNLDMVQLHGSEPPEYCNEIHDLGIKVIKSFGIDQNFEFSVLEEFEPFCHYFLFDTISPHHGGSGQKFDWALLQKYDGDIPVFLSGGIEPDDAETIKNFNLKKISGIDINSRFEISPGLKDINLISEFLEKIRSKQLMK